MTIPLSPEKATETIRRIAESTHLDFIWTLHAKERMDQRDIIMGDVIYALKNGFVYEGASEASRGMYKYPVVSKCPSSGNRRVCVIAIITREPSDRIKVVSVMWADESA